VILSNIEVHHHAKFSWNWSIKSRDNGIFRSSNWPPPPSFRGNKNLNGSHDHNQAPFGVIFYSFGKTWYSLHVYQFDSSSLSRSLDMGWVESVIFNWCEFLFSVLTVFHTFSLPYFPLLHFPLPHFQRPQGFHLHIESLEILIGSHTLRVKRTHRRAALMATTARNRRSTTINNNDIDQSVVFKRQTQQKRIAW